MRFTITAKPSNTLTMGYIYNYPIAAPPLGGGMAEGSSVHIVLFPNFSLRQARVWYLQSAFHCHGNGHVLHMLTTCFHSYVNTDQESPVTFPYSTNS